MKNFKLILISLIFILVMPKIIFSAPYINLNLVYDGKNHQYNEEEVYLFINSNKLENLTMPPIILNNYTLVPAREVFENIGAKVSWDNTLRKVSINYNSTEIILTIDSLEAKVNDTLKTMQIPAKIINNKTMIPVRFVSEAIGAEVKWDNPSRSIFINIQNNQNSNTQDISNNINIINFELPDSDEVFFKITTDKEIESFKVIKNNKEKFEVEIYNSNNNLKSDNFKTVVDPIDEVSITQNNNNTIFSFNIIDEVNMNAYLTNDKTTLIIAFDKNSINSIELFNQNDQEILKITSKYIPKFNIESIKEKMIITLENTNIENLSLSESIDYGKIIKNIKYYQLSENNVNIEIEFAENITNTSFNINVKDNVIFVNFSNSKEINYNHKENKIIISKYDKTIDINSITHTDNYIDREYTLTFNTDISDLINKKIYDINTELVKNIEVLENNGKTQLKINSNKVITVDITEDNNNIYINILNPKDKYKNIIVLDAGHGGSDSGTTNGALLEKDINLDIVNRIVTLSENDGDIKIYTTRTTDVYPSFEDRTNLGNDVGDIFISIHINSAGNNTAANGTEVYYLNENISSSGLKSSKLAEKIQESLLSYLKTNDRGVKTANFKVLRDSSIPAVLCEIAFLSNPTDAQNLASEDFRQKAAEAIYQACKSIFSKYPRI